MQIRQRFHLRHKKDRDTKEKEIGKSRKEREDPSVVLSFFLNCDCRYLS